MSKPILPATLGELKKSGYKSKRIKDEMRDNLILKLQQGDPTFPGIVGYEESVIPDTERAILSRHNILFLGLRGQAKTRMARQMIELLDEYIPVIAGSETNDDPLHPLSRYAQELITEKGDATPVAWLHRSERYGEKLATPDVSVADLIGDIDPIKAANLKLTFADERVIHYGIIPRSNRGIFVINELPDLQARIQVALFNILQEGDIQIRGFKLRLPVCDHEYLLIGIFPPPQNIHRQFQSCYGIGMIRPHLQIGNIPDLNGPCIVAEYYNIQCVFWIFGSDELTERHRHFFSRRNAVFTIQDHGM